MVFAVIGYDFDKTSQLTLPDKLFHGLRAAVDHFICCQRPVFFFEVFFGNFGNGIWLFQITAKFGEYFVEGNANADG